MSAMDLLPADVVESVRLGETFMRGDLLLIPEAEAAGWAVSFRNDHWHNAAGFAKGAMHVWSTGRDWRRALLVDGRYQPPTVFPCNLEGLRAALALTVEG